MSGTALDHRLVRDYLGELDAAMRGLPAAQARELREQITAHLDDALGPDAGDEEVAATLSRLGAPADLAADAGAPPGRRSWRVRWRLALVVVVSMVTAATLAALQISTDVSNDVAAGRDQQLARLSTAVAEFTRAAEDERDLSAAYAATRPAGPVPATLADARAATDGAVSALRGDAADLGAGYQPGTVQALHGLLASLADLGNIRRMVSSTDLAAGIVISVYTNNIIAPASTLSASVADATSDAGLESAATALAALLRVGNDQSAQRAIVYVALSRQPPVLYPTELAELRQLMAATGADLTAFDSSAGLAEQELFAKTVAGPAVDAAAQQEQLAESMASVSPSGRLASNADLNAASWYGNMSTTVGDTRKIASELTGQITDQANTLKSNAAKSLLLTSIATLVLLLVLLISAALARSLPRLRPGRPEAVTC